MPKRVAVVIETSGSTGTPKRVMLATNALLAGAAASTVALGGAGQWLLALPLHYIAGVQVLVRSIAAETTPLMLPSGHFDPQDFLRLAETMTESLRYTALVPVQLARLLDAADDPALLSVLRRFTAILVGGQAIRPDLIARAAELDVRVVRTYGSSETAGGCIYNGVPIGDTLVRVVDGQLELSGAVLAEGYLGDAALTAERFILEHGVRWYRTGDLGEVDPVDGRVTVLGRADNVIISGGEKVSLDAVEGIVRSCPGFEQAVVIGADDDEWGQVPVVVVGGGTADFSAVAAAVVAVLGRAARPARVVRVEAIPLLASGKPDRRALAGTALGSAALATNMGAWHKELGRSGPNNND
ncbi:o-succinylbenzoate--CoA ligase [Cryobacterium serini]|uniref:O-succinylbenzoate--CoA ligase n=1 Tax=Cryobacterium serini TaxID=1259201 RepID=A0A4R9BMP4_9MICO|nr:o-succinylbenzoate--CoA ligase [Cryobacterium serini]